MKIISDKNSNTTTNLIIIFFVAFVITLAGYGVYVLHFIINEDLIKNITEQRNIWSQFGNYAGGALSPILAFAALIALLYSIHYQVTEFRKSTQQLEESAIALKSQNDLIQKQSFEVTFFQLLKLYNQIVQDLQMSQEESKKINDALKNDKTIPEYELEETETKNRQCIKKLSRILEHLQKNRSGLNTGCRRNDLDEAYESFFSMYRDKIGHYFRVIYNILKYVNDFDKFDENDKNDKKLKFSYKRKKFYTNILRAQLSEHELKLLFYNSISKYGKQKMLPLVESYELLKHLEIHSMQPLVDDLKLIYFILDEEDGLLSREE